MLILPARTTSSQARSQLEPGADPIVWNSDRLWHFGYMQSSIFMAWVRAFAGRLKSRLLRRTPTPRARRPAPAARPAPSRVGSADRRCASPEAIRVRAPAEGVHGDDLRGPPGTDRVAGVMLPAGPVP